MMHMITLIEKFLKKCVEAWEEFESYQHNRYKNGSYVHSLDGTQEEETISAGDVSAWLDSLEEKK